MPDKEPVEIFLFYKQTAVDHLRGEEAPYA
jgi:hypothetical protein